jgi:hypothetical protein
MAKVSLADELLDELLPAALDWRHVVGRYPRAAVAAAVVVGFWLGRSRGPALVAALGAHVASELGETVSELLGD